MATYFSVKSEVEASNEWENLNEMESYARQMFRDQPNRMFVRCLILTERHARLVHFDRAGSQITPPIDIHQHPRTLIRLVAGLSSPNERLLGLDDSIQWTIVDGRKTSGTLNTLDATGNRKAFPIIEEIPVPREAISGRATTCWKVEDPESGQQYVAKDSWRPSDQSPEHELLELVRGLPGVADIVSYEVGRGETSDFRCPSTFGSYYNRYAGRVLVKCYGKPIQFFTSVLQLICAIRDAIAGHQRMLSDDIRILHRDISSNNVLLGEVGAPEGHRGVLIDLDMAFRATEDKPTVRTDVHIGTRVFQSVSLLETFSLQNYIAPHDYLDDMESFFYLLAYIFLLFKPDGSRRPDTDGGASIIREWGDKDFGVGMEAKGGLLGLGQYVDRVVGLVQDVWGPVCSGLFDKYRNYMADIHDDKLDLLGASHGDPSVNPYESLHTLRNEHYSTILGMFDHAIEAIETQSPTSAQPAQLPNDKPATASARGQGAGHEAKPAESQGTSPADRSTGHPFPPVAIPTPSTHSSSLPIATQARRSAGPQSLHLTTPNTSPSGADNIPAHHSARIPKRRLEDIEDDEHTAPPAKVRHTKMGGAML